MRTLAVLLLLAETSLVVAGDSLADRLRKLPVDTIVLGPVKESPLAGMLARDAKAILRQANLRDAQAWDKVRTRADWEKFRDGRLAALRQSLGKFPLTPSEVHATITRTITGDGFDVQNLVVASSPEVLTANLYRPARSTKSMPGIIVVHSHHQAKNTGYRQDMGMTWARAGCLVMIPDLPGHGERRQHPFRSETDFAQPFRLGQQDYYFRFDASLRLYAAGNSLMGWYVGELMRSLDVLLRQPGIDPKRIIVVSEPAGGGDVAAVFAALDSRLTGLVVNNFGGPQPETPYPLPRDAEHSFEYAGNGSWESTRNLHRSARDGFLPWTIVASLAPRHLIYYHEFYWDRDNDPVWARLQKVYGFYEAKDKLTGIAGHGFVSGQPPANTHWLAESRELFYPVLESWFRIPNPKKEYNQRLPEKDLECLPKMRPEQKYTPQSAALVAAERLRAARTTLAGLKGAEKKAHLRKELGRLLGDVEPTGPAIVRRVQTNKLDGIRVERIHLQTEPGIVVPVVLLLPPAANRKVPVVVGLAQKGKETLLREKAEVVAELLKRNVAVCLPDLRGWGETSPGEARDRGSSITSVSASYLMDGQTLVGARLRDLRAVLNYLRQRPEIGQGIALWSESFAPVNPLGRDWKVPHGIADRPALAEPSAGLVALLGCLFDDDVWAISVHGGLGSFQSLLESPFVYVPHAAIIPGVLTVADISDWMEALAPRPLRMAGTVSALNRRLSVSVLEGMYAHVRQAYQKSEPTHFVIVADAEEQTSVGAWLGRQLLNRP